MKSALLSLSFFFIFSSTPIFANDLLVEQFVSALGESDIVLLGEQHKRLESCRLFAQIIDQYTLNGKCLTVALEIRSDQQGVLDHVMRGERPVEDVQISPIVDHLGYRQMLSKFQEFQLQNRCIKVLAIDAPPGLGGRDPWMASTLAPYLSEGKVIALLGNTHVFKKIVWECESSGPPLGERLVASGFSVASVLQHWWEEKEEKSSRASIFSLEPEDVERATYFLSILPPKFPGELADGVIRW